MLFTIPDADSLDAAHLDIMRQLSACAYLIDIVSNYFTRNTNDNTFPENAKETDGRLQLLANWLFSHEEQEPDTDGFHLGHPYLRLTDSDRDSLEALVLLSGRWLKSVSDREGKVTCLTTYPAQFQIMSRCELKITPAIQHIQLVLK